MSPDRDTTSAAPEPGGVPGASQEGGVGAQPRGEGAQGAGLEQHLGFKVAAAVYMTQLQRDLSEALAVCRAALARVSVAAAAAAP